MKAKTILLTALLGAALPTHAQADYDTCLMSPDTGEMTMVDGFYCDYSSTDEDCDKYAVAAIRKHSPRLKKYDLGEATRTFDDTKSSYGCQVDYQTGNVYNSLTFWVSETYVDGLVIYLGDSFSEADSD